ncbi:hypothetical protein LSTR_LSTR011959 [Laodelphax striatellus]|uniref:Uncharacterized protein n=1 Tax=Laodelphax striatellus TaxID=195883 RepID=A0A482WY22_LAOST|nr:hypothetical protein LSTR_LSTR011959 [Laodelphax striatellus]
MWMEALCKRRSLSLLKRTLFDQRSSLGSNNFGNRLQHTIHTEPRYQPIERQDFIFTLDTNFCSCCHEYRTARTTTTSRRFFSITSCIPVTLLVLFLLTNSSYANAQSLPETTAVSLRPDPGISTPSILSYEEEKLKILENQPQARTIPGAPYYEFFINEASYKFWAVFQLTTVFILLFSAFAAIYYAKYTFLTEIETLKDEDIILRRRRQLSSETAQQIIKATTSLPPLFKDRSRGHRLTIADGYSS